jgi:site-specific DNA-methyltransferase (adenine-specific)
MNWAATSPIEEPCNFLRKSGKFGKDSWAGDMANHLYYGDNLDILRNDIASDSVDLIYLDPPFNSQANYNILFKAPTGEQSEAQIEAFEDTWHWNEHAEQAFDDVIKSGNTDAAEMLRAMRSFLKENDMMAYLTMMAVRLIELHRVLKPTGSLYLHCDPTASHYLKILLDAIFGAPNFQNEIIWQRTNSHNMKTKGYVRANDTILFYAKTKDFKFIEQYTAYGPEQLKRFKPDENGRLPTRYERDRRHNREKPPFRGNSRRARGSPWRRPSRRHGNIAR